MSQFQDRHPLTILLSTCKEGDLNVVSGTIVWDMFRISIEYINEGLDGDFDPEDPDDKRMYRFRCDYRRSVSEDLREEDWVEFEDSSYCTACDVTESRVKVVALLMWLKTRLEGRMEAEGGEPMKASMKRPAEGASWVDWSMVAKGEA